MYTLLYLGWITNRDLLYSVWNSVRCVMAWMGGEFGGEWVHVYVWLGSFAVHLKLSQHCMLVGYTPVQNKKFKKKSRYMSMLANSWLIRKDPDAGKDWRQKGKRVTEDEMVGWHQWCNGHELEQTPGDGAGQGGLACCSPWGLKESDMAGWLNNNNKRIMTWRKMTSRTQVTETLEAKREYLSDIDTVHVIS